MTILLRLSSRLGTVEASIDDVAGRVKRLEAVQDAALIAGRSYSPPTHAASPGG